MSTATGLRWLVVPDENAAEPSRDLVGGKAWSLWRMRSLGLRVPPAFVVTTAACEAYFADGGLPEGLADELITGIRLLEKQLGRTFGGTERPLLVSVRSGAAISMPGMMDTILDLGCNDEVEAALAAESGDRDFAAEVHRRFTGFYGRLVLGCTEELEDLPIPRRSGRRSPPISVTPCRPTRGSSYAPRWRGVRIESISACPRLPQALRHPGRSRHRGHRAGDGVRQPRRRLRHRGAVHP